MKRRVLWSLILCLGIICLLAGCQSRPVEQEKKSELAYTILSPDEIPEELGKIIQENQEYQIKLGYRNEGNLYLVRGYGQQKTGGYSITVNEVILSENGIIINTSLIGPGPEEEISEEPSYPYIVLKLEDREGELFFE